MTAQRFSGRGVMVTGGGSGIGRAACLAFAADGAWVALGDIDTAAGERVAAEIEAAGGRAVFVPGDATREDDVVALVSRTLAAFGRLDHAFNNVGLSREADFETMTEADWDWTLAISLKSAWLAMKHELPVMRAAGHGTIVNTASMAGKVPGLSGPAYAAAKAGVVHLSACAAVTYAAHGIRVNSVSPGLTATPLIARMFDAARQQDIARKAQLIPRAVTPEEIAAAVLFLSSDAAAMITGTDMEVCGGRR